ncbi:ATP synthase subunit I [Thalassotalea ganghwensis]
MSTWQNNALAKNGRQFAIKQLFAMCIVVIACTVTTYFIWGLSYAYSTLVGGIVVIIPNVVFALKAFRYAGASKAQLVAKSFYSGAKLKLALTAILFALAFKFLVLVPSAFLTGFCLVLAMPLLTPIFIKI